jgi:hypothetical protein
MKIKGGATQKQAKRQRGGRASESTGLRLGCGMAISHTEMAEMGWKWGQTLWRKWGRK